MKLVLVRQAKAMSGARGTEEPGDDVDLLRPLSAEGRLQSRAIGDLLSRELAGDDLSRIVSSPAVRCQQTLEPLAVASGLPIEVDERLSKGESLQRLLELMPSVEEGTVVFCTHQRLITSLIQLFELADPESGTAPPARKGSVWILEGQGESPTVSRYFEPVTRPTESGEAGTDTEVRLINPSPAAGRGVRIATVDLGSTSFNLLIADVTRQGSIRPVVREKVMLRLGAVLASSKAIPEPVCSRALTVARELRDVIEQEKVEQLIPIATAAIREARNGRFLAERIGTVLRQPVRILSGEEEAVAMFRAFSHRLELGSEPATGLDLGGGSLELATGSGEEVLYSATTKCGVARLHGKLVQSDPMSPSERTRTRERVRSALEPHIADLLAPGPRRTIATGGYVRGLARLLDEGFATPTGVPTGPREIDLDSLRTLCEELCASNQKNRLEMRGIQRRRADLLPTAAVVLTEAMTMLGAQTLTVCDWGLREGIALDAVGALRLSSSPE